LYTPLLCNYTLIYVVILVIIVGYKDDYTISVTKDKRGGGGRDKPISEAEKVGPSLV